MEDFEPIVELQEEEIAYLLQLYNIPASKFI